MGGCRLLRKNWHAEWQIHTTQKNNTQSQLMWVTLNCAPYVDVFGQTDVGGDRQILLVPSIKYESALSLHVFVQSGIAHASRTIEACLLLLNPYRHLCR